MPTDKEQRYDEARKYVLDSIEGFIDDPAETAFQKGYLAALMTVAKEGFHVDKSERVPYKGE